MKIFLAYYVKHSFLFIFPLPKRLATPLITPYVRHVSYGLTTVVSFWFCTHTDRRIQRPRHVTILKGCQCQALLLLLLFNAAVQLNAPRPLIDSFAFGGKKKKKKIWRIYSFYSTLSRSNENGYDDYMCKCTKSLTLQRYIIPKLQKILKHAFNCLKGCWMLPLKKVAVLKISNCWWGFLGTFVTSMLLLHLPDNLSRHGGVEIDCVVPQALSCLVTLSAATFEGFAYADLCSVAILGVVLDAVHILISFFTSRNRTGERFLVPAIHAHWTKDSFRADSTFCSPGLIAVRFFIVYFLLIIFTTCWSTATKWRGRSDWRGDGRSKASTAVARWSGYIPTGHRAWQSQREFRLNLLLQRLLLTSSCICHKPVNVT